MKGWFKTMDNASRILEIAERQMRQAGYNAVSYRDVAAEMGLRSASLHYHFPKKENLGVALVRRYSDKFKSQLAASISDDTSPQEMINVFVDTYSVALKEQKLLCLCAVLGAEADGLPKPVAVEVTNFFAENVSWLTARFDALSFTQPSDQAKTTLALLQGAMIISAASEDNSVFDAAVRSIQDKLAY